MPNNYSIDFYNALKKKWWIIALFVVALVGILLLRQSKQTVQYEASSLLTIRSKAFPTPYMDPEMASAYLNSDSTIENIAKKTGLDRKEGARVVGKISVSPVAQFLRLSYMDSNPKKAVRLINAAGGILFEKASEIPKKKVKLIKKRIAGINKSLELNDKLGKQQIDDTTKTLLSKNLSDSERTMLSSWQTQIFSSIETKSSQLVREKLDLKLQMNNTLENTPQLTKALFAKKVPVSRKSAAIVLGTLGGLLLGAAFTVCLEFWQQKLRNG